MSWSTQYWVSLLQTSQYSATQSADILSAELLGDRCLSPCRGVGKFTWPVFHTEYATVPCPSQANSTSSGAWLRCERLGSKWVPCCSRSGGRTRQAGRSRRWAIPLPGAPPSERSLSFLDKKPTPFRAVSCTSSFLQKKNPVVNNYSVVPVPKTSFSSVVNNFFPFICFLIANVSASSVRQGLEETVMCLNTLRILPYHKEGSETALSPMLPGGCKNSHKGSERISEG